jgi:hypothetical protein
MSLWDIFNHRQGRREADDLLECLRKSKQAIEEKRLVPSCFLAGPRFTYLNLPQEHFIDSDPFDNYIGSLDGIPVIYCRAMRPFACVCLPHNIGMIHKWEASESQNQ